MAQSLRFKLMITGSAISFLIVLLAATYLRVDDIAIAANRPRYLHEHLINITEITRYGSQGYGVNGIYAGQTMGCVMSIPGSVTNFTGPVYWCKDACATDCVESPGVFNRVCLILVVDFSGIMIVLFVLACQAYAWINNDAWISNDNR